MGHGLSKSKTQASRNRSPATATMIMAMLIISALDQRAMRTAALMRKLGGVSQKMLTQTLKELERNGLVIRDDKQTVPPHVEYHLSAVGRSLSDTLVVPDRWAETHFGELDAACERYDAEHDG
ncbi:helix-turn-helix transcriptional regulator [Ensifer sp. IC4062]|nr:helix-turn-helix transcriptional regulator [Ensifer sp. IC4062]